MAVGDAHFQNKSFARMQEMMSGGTTVIMVSHSIGQIRTMCNRVIWLKDHKVFMDGEPEMICSLYEAEVK